MTSSNNGHKINDCVLSTNGLEVQLNETEILRGIDLTIKKGEFVGIIGPNGAGKTTLLKSLNGIYKASGKITLNGIDINKMKHKEIARYASLMHQNSEVTFPFTALDIVLIGRYPYLKRTKGETPEDYALARKYMKFVGVEKLEDKPITQMSGGEKQRVFFAKTLAQQTDIILLDEPTSSLDIALEEQIFRHAKDLCSEGKTVIAAVHDLKIAARYCSRLVLLKDGVIIADGTSEEVITAENLSKAYSVNAVVYRNRITGALDYHLQNPTEQSSNKKVHIIGGGGSASGIIRYLSGKGCKVTGGVFSHGDSDLSSAEIFGMEVVSCRPFTEIDDDAYSKNISMIKKADITILCNMPFGKLNVRNLEAAKSASKLVIIEDEAPEGRDYTQGKALKIYNELKKEAIIIQSAKLQEII